MILYIETNFLMSAATGRAPRAADILKIPAQELRIALPDICVLEAWYALDGERRRFRQFNEALSTQIAEIQRDAVSAHAVPLAQSLQQALLQGANRFNDVQRRFEETLQALIARSEFIPLSRRSCVLNQAQRMIEKPADNLILHAICEHASQEQDENRALLSENRNDFGTPVAREFMRASGLGQYFAQSEGFLAWYTAHRAQPGPG